MVTITISEALARQRGLVQVFGEYDGPDDRYVFGVREFEDLSVAESHARRMMNRFGADHLRRVKE